MFNYLPFISSFITEMTCKQLMYLQSITNHSSYKNQGLLYFVFILLDTFFFIPITVDLSTQNLIIMDFAIAI